MKKLVSLIIAVAMILCLATTAMATEVTFTSNDTVERTYDGYKLLDLTVSLKTGEHHPADCDGTSHGDKCYNYSYTVNPDYFDVLAEEAWNNAANTVWPEGVKPALSEVTEEQILAYLSNQTGMSDGSYGTLHVVAERVYEQIKDLDPDAEGVSATVNVEQGYWIFVDKTDLDGVYGANSMIIVDTKGQNSLTITPKTAIPTVEKKVKDINDTEVGNIMAKPWWDSADHDIGDAVPFKLTATLPANVTYYDEYFITFHDTLADGLTLNDSNHLGGNPIFVRMYPSYNAAEANFNMDGGTDVTGYFTLVEDATDCTFEVQSNQSILNIPGVTANSVFVVYYEATLNEDAVIGAAGNPNTVYLEYSNDPYSDSTGKTKEDKVTVFTYELVIDKVDEHGHSLNGADFTLSKLNPTTKEYVEVTRKAVEDGVKFTWTGLDDGDYKLVETVVPDGYNEMKPIEFTIYAVHETESQDPQLTLLDGDVDLGQGDVATGIIQKEIINKTGTILPETGAEGTMMLVIGGTLLVVIAAVFMVTRKKMSVYED